MENETMILSSIQEMLQAAPTYWAVLAQRAAPELLTRQPAQGEWSAIECLLHLIDTEAVFQSRIQAFLDGRDFPAFNPDQQGTRASGQASASDLAAEFARRRAAGLEVLARLTATDLERRARHAELGPVTLREMIHEWVAHDLNHTIQAERALMQPFLQNCGPWQKYFQEHIVK